MDDALSLTNSYWNMLKSLSNEVKLRLAARLTESVIHSEESVKDLTEEMLDKYSGAWSDSRDADQIVKDIYDGRHSSGKEPLQF
ncbi:hypothetical protein H8784_08575 [Parabacteroides acidifaciens]|uniref:Uncharacterized protein n=1 Tax=Parabacteroides acidifaciens TaxID=2290935 RepID=A0A3D8HFY3_9BACT|nr:hypothetical protein [Parabacteroides acidifaciens]MBC8601775.1 hypothetical protein [Parabacteroides acidifaciens]RDU49467.1 hypothetical protein DWU89_08780 [Parabacteroides acidifaciens]